MRSPVFTVRLKFAVPPGVGVTVCGVIEHVDWTGSPLQLNVTCCENPLIEVIEIPKVAAWPAETVAEVAEGVTEKSAFTPVPVPESRITCGLPGALSDTVIDPELEPCDAGV